MNKTLSEGLKLVDEIVSSSENNSVLKIIAPPFIHLASIADKLKGKEDFEVAAQNCHQVESGAFTGEVSAEMIASTGAKYIIIGHSERRIYFGENNSLLAQKVLMALANNVIPIFCLGENAADRAANIHLDVVKQQMKESLFNLLPADFSKVIVAYEPVWAIGTGVTATTHQAQGMHNFIRSEINKKYGKMVSEESILLYGGSVNAENAKELFACLDVDGGLIGGASLKAGEFGAIVNSF